MYQYDQLDQAFVDQRVAEFRDQTRRYVAGELSEDEFRPLRLRNGLYLHRHNLQCNWPNRTDVPDILAELATVQMHAIQTSGNCVRNVPADHLAGTPRDEIDDPRPYCEII